MVLFISISGYSLVVSFFGSASQNFFLVVAQSRWETRAEFKEIGVKQLRSYGWLIWMFAAVSSAAAPGIDSKRLAVLENTLDQYVQDGRLAGGVLYVSRRGETVLHKAFGWQDRERSIAMNTRSLHRIASQTKAFTSVAIMLLQERGALLISDPVSKYFPEW